MHDVRMHACRRYTRNLVGGDSRFNVIVMGWSEGQRTPIHDHAGSHCIMKIVSGEVWTKVQAHIIIGSAYMQVRAEWVVYCMRMSPSLTHAACARIALAACCIISGRVRCVRVFDQSFF